ncbi:MAG TPA: hypothetical protein DEQ17_06090 [Prevotella sp.]|nr:hypothetical protein [Prevotella sp.]
MSFKTPYIFSGIHQHGWQVALLSLLALTFAPSPASASTQRRFRFYNGDATSRLMHKYADSLLIFRDSLYRDSVHATPIKPIDTAPYFLPFTFYDGVADKALSIDKKLSDTDSTLLSLYLSHPEWVINTERRLETTGPVIKPKTIKESPTEIIEKALPKEPDRQPIELVVFKPDFWHFGGDYYLQFLQNYLSGNWYQGGESNYSMMGSVTLSANYNNKQKVKWDNKLEMKFGMQTSKSDSIHSVKPTEDLLRYTGKLGLQAASKWYYTFQLIAQTQWARHYDSNSRAVKSDLFSPLNVNLSVGMDYSANWLKGKLYGSFHIAPFAYNFKYVGRLALASNNGIESEHHSLHDFGSQTTIDLTWKFSDNISWKTRLYAYTTYKRMEAEWENTISFQFNRYLATNIFLYPRFDDGRTRDDKLGYWMFREYFSIGFSYSI